MSGNAKHQLSLTAHELMSEFDSGAIDPAEFLTCQLDFASSTNRTLNSFIELGGSKEARAKTDTRSGFHGKIGERALDDRSVLRAVPMSFKDVFAVEGFHATAGSRILEGYRPPFDSTIAARVRAVGCRVVGKTSLDEFAMGSSNETCAFGPTLNPWDLGRVPGGSSGGGAVSVAACQSVVGWGTDTGGSVRQPAALTGIVGFKPTYGLLSRFGIIAYASSLDTPSIFARDALDVALLLNTVCRPDPLDSTCEVEEPVPDFVLESEPDRLGKPRFGIIKELSSKDFLHPGVFERFIAAIDALTRAGALIEEVSFPLYDIALPAYYIITTAECSSNLSRYDGIRYGPGGESVDGLQEMYLSRRGGESGFGDETKRRILLGTYVLSAGYYDAYYNKARAIRRAIADEIARLSRTYDALILPTTPDPAFKLGERMDDPVKMYMSDISVALANLAGTCAVSLPCGMVPADETGLSEGARDAGVTDEKRELCREGEEKIRLPVGFQMIGGRFADAKLLALARFFEEATGLGYEVPPFALR